MPRCSFVQWLVCKNRLRTRDRLKRWGKLNDSRCVLCGNAEENRDHLFFQCPFTQEIWQEVKRRNLQGYQCQNWLQEEQIAAQRYVGSSLKARLSRLSLSVCIYCLWIERNLRIFQNKYRNTTAVMCEVERYIIGRTWNWRVPRKFENWLLCKEWGIRECVLY